MSGNDYDQLLALRIYKEQLNIEPDMGAYRSLIDTYGHDRAMQAAWEVGYYDTFKELPVWATMIERVEPINGGHKFTYRD